MFGWLRKLGRSRETYAIKDVSDIREGDRIPVESDKDVMETILSLGMAGNFSQGEVKTDENGNKYLVIEEIKDVR